MKVDSKELLKRVQSLEVVEHDKQAAATLEQELRKNINELEEQLTEKNKVTASLNPLTPNDCYRGRTAPLTSKCCILYIYSINIGTEYFKHGMYSPFLSLQIAVCFIILTYLVPVLFTFYIQSVLKFKKIIPAPND